MMRKRFKKRLLSLVLCGAMIFTLCPQTAIAKTADDSAESITVSDGYGEDEEKALETLVALIEDGFGE